jgi:hypothetical protein
VCSSDLNSQAFFVGDTALHVAIAHNHPKMVSHLLEQGADVHIKNFFTDQTPFELAASLGRRECLKLLIKKCIPLNSEAENMIWLNILKEERRILDCRIQQAVNKQKYAVSCTFFQGRSYAELEKEEFANYTAIREYGLLGPQAKVNALGLLGCSLSSFICTFTIGMCFLLPSSSQSSSSSTEERETINEAIGWSQLAISGIALLILLLSVTERVWTQLKLGVSFNQLDLIHALKSQQIIESLKKELSMIESCINKINSFMVQQASENSLSELTPLHLSLAEYETRGFNNV